MNITVSSWRVLRQSFAAVAIFALVLLSAQGIFARTAFAAALPNQAKLQQWSDVSNDWQNGSLNDINSNYAEGDVVPYRLDLTAAQIDIGVEYTFNICRDYQDGSVRGFLNLQTFDTSRAATAGGTITDTNGAFDGVNVTINSVNDTNLQGSCHADEFETQMSITKTAATAYLLWGGYLATPSDVGAGNSASNWPGASLHMDAGGEDRSIATSALIPQPLPATLTVTKTVDGGTLTVADFPLFVGTTSVTSGVATQFPAGDYVVSETGDSNYSASVWGGNCAEDGSITMEEGQTYSCTITNTYVPPLAKLKIVKNVVNGTETPASWTMSATASGNEYDFNDSGDPSVATFHTVAAGLTYAMSESEVAGYGLTDISCDGGSRDGNDITLEPDTEVTCTFTNTFIPPKVATLHVVKKLIQDNGGTETHSDFSFNFDGVEYDWSDSATTESVKTFYIPESDFGTYNVTEVMGAVVTDRYAVSDSNCTDLDLSFDGAEETCTITNDDIAPQLTVIKEVINDDKTASAQATDFALFASSTEFVTGETKDMTPGLYTLSETGPTDGYNATYSCVLNGGGPVAGNTIDLDLGDTATCTITNDDKEPDRAYITVTKTVVNDNGGTLEVADFPLFVNDVRVTSGVTHEVFAEGTYTISEQNQLWYKAGTWGGDCAPDGTLSGVVLGGSYNCTITNDDIAKSGIDIDKVVTGVGANENQVFKFAFSGAMVTNTSLAASSLDELGEYSSLAAGTYRITEYDIPSRWDLASITCSSNLANEEVNVNLDTDSVRIDLRQGEYVNCTFTNEYFDGDDEYIIVRKEVTEGSDTAQNFDFIFTDFDGSTSSFSLANGQENELHNLLGDMTYSVEEFMPNEYWSQQDVTCTSDDTEGNINPAEFVLHDGEVITCVFTNDQELFELQGYVWNDVDKDGIFDEDESPLPNWAVHATNGTKNLATTSDANGYYHFWVAAGTWTISETLKSGWDQTFPVVNAGTHIVVVPDEIYEAEPEQTEENTLVSAIVDFFMPVAFAQAAPVLKDFNFGNVERSGGGGGTPAPRCRDFTISSPTFRAGDVLTLLWETAYGTEMTITANGTEIFATGDNSVVDNGDLEVTPTEDTEYELTVMRSGRSDTCTVAVTEAPTPQVLGEQVSAVPLGAANTGAGGAAPVEVPHLPLVAVAFLRVIRRNV